MLISSIKRIIDSIRNFQEDLKDRTIIEKLQVLIDFIIFNFKTSKSEATILKKFPMNSVEFIKLLLLKLKLFIKYEGKYLMLSTDCFSLLKILFLTFLNNIPQARYEDEDVIEVLCLLMSVVSKIYLIRENMYHGKKTTEFEVNLIQDSLLTNLRETIVVSTSNFWKSYFDFKFRRRANHDNSTKTKVISIAESMIFYHFFLSLDMDLTTRFVENCLQVFNINLRLIKNTVMLKVGQILYTLTEFYNKKSDPTPLHTKEISTSFVLGLVANSGYCDPSSVQNILCLNRDIKSEVSKSMIRALLYKKTTDITKRRFLWLKFASVSEQSEFKFFDEPIKCIPTAMREQIEIDIVRTKLWKGEAYQSRIRDLIVSFLEQVDCEFEYFQGFNYITAFFAEVFDTKKDFLHFMNHIASCIFSVI